MNGSSLIETLRSLLRSDERRERRSARFSAIDDPSSTADEFSGEWSDGFPVPAERDGELRDLLVELNVTTHEYIRMALQHHGGRLRQQEIADLTGWSEPTVSQKLGEMEDAGHITRFRTGREKIVCLPDDSPVDATEESDDDDRSSVQSDSASSTPSSVQVNRETSPAHRDGSPVRDDADSGAQDGTLPEQDAPLADQDGTPENRDAPSQ